MNRWSLLRDNLVTALAAIPAIAALGPIERITTTSDIWGVGRGPVVVAVARTGSRWHGDPELTYNVDQEAHVVFAVVIKTDSAGSNVSGLEGVGMAEDIAGNVLAVREADIGIYDMGDLNTGGVNLIARSEDVILSPKRIHDGVGPLAIVLTFATTPHAL